MQVSTCDLIDFDSDIVVYEGNCESKTQIACNGDGDNCGGYSSNTSFTVTQGNNYLIRVGGWGSSSMGSGQLFIEGPGGECETTPCVGDIDEDGTVSVTDLLAIVGMWGETGGAGDIDGSGAVGVGDLLMAIDAWGVCPE
jgi:hypothetical protein